MSKTFHFSKNLTSPKTPLLTRPHILLIEQSH